MNYITLFSGEKIKSTIFLLAHEQQQQRGSRQQRAREKH
jgi:hypothetical protein